MTVRDELERQLVQLPGLLRQRSRYGDSFSYSVGPREIAHFHGDSRMDVRLTKELIREMKHSGTLDPRVKTRGSSANWAEVKLDRESDIALAIELVEEAIRANQ